MKNGWPSVLILAFFVLASGCADVSSSPSGSASTSPMAEGEHPDGHMMGNMTGEEFEMYSVATDLSSTPETWFRFRPDSFDAKVGDMLNVTLKAAVGNQYPHSLVINELGVDLGPIEAGATASTMLMAEKAGSYTFYCAEGNHRELGMVGTLTVS